MCGVGADAASEQRKCPPINFKEGRESVMTTQCLECAISRKNQLRSYPLGPLGDFVGLGIFVIDQRPAGGWVVSGVHECETATIPKGSGRRRKIK